MLNSKNIDVFEKSLKVNQANVFYNYTVGFESAQVDLLKTGRKLLKIGVSQSIFFSDFKCLYLDEHGQTQVEVVTPEWRNGDSNWKIEFGKSVPEHIANDLINSFQITFHENQFTHERGSFLRTNLPPIMLENGDSQIPLYASAKIHEDGIAILSFQFDGTWEGLDEKHFLSDVVNIYKRYFKSIWIDSRLQQLDSEVVLEDAFEDTFSIGGSYLTGWKVKRTINKLKRESQKVLDDAFQVAGHSFHLGGFDWSLHQIAGTENDAPWESTVELCRSIYSNALSGLIVTRSKERKKSLKSFMWQGRPSISLLRFEEQPQTKIDLLNNFSRSMSKILMRADSIQNLPELPPDLRFFNDVCLHANRSIILWTWIKPDNSSVNVWDDADTPSKLFENQARTEQIEYHNLKIARACSWAQNPPSSDCLLYAYKTLASSESMIHQSSSSGEVTDALSYLIDKFGTTGLIASSKEAARYHLDELKYKSDKAKSRSDRWLTFVFGLVGTTTLADFAVHPFVKEAWPKLSPIHSPIVSFGVSGGLVLLIAMFIWLVSNKRG
jgi:hypothetical protein